MKNPLSPLVITEEKYFTDRTEKEILFELRKEVKDTLEMVADRVQ